jgi:subtilisin family serine protease
MSPIELVLLPRLMERSSGRDIVVGLIDGPVALDHPDLADADIHAMSGKDACSLAQSLSCAHGTLAAGVLVARRDSRAPAICPGCTLLVRAIFPESEECRLPTASAEELARAITECVNAGARVLNISAVLAQPSAHGEAALRDALDYAVYRGVMIVAAAGNQARVGSSIITRHAHVIPVAACDRRGLPLDESNLGGSIARHGVSAPGDGVESLGTKDRLQPFTGTSAAAPFVTGAIVLLWSLFPRAKPAQLKRAVTGADGGDWRRSIVPPLLNGDAAYASMQQATGRIMQ